MRVKVCGITNLEDALCAVEAGVDALGFVFYKKSPRYIEPTRAREIIDKLPPFIECVGLFVNETTPIVDKICFDAHITTAQLHFDVDEEYLERLNTKPLSVVRAQTKEDLGKFSGTYRLVDAYVKEYGGAGKRLNLEWFKGRDNSKIILAGGLSLENIEELRGYGFYGVDASSSLEVAKGVKSCDKVREFIKRAKAIA